MADEATDLGSSGFGLMYYNARWYDPGISMFTSPDTLIPNLYNSADWNRYGYARFNPIRYNDPTGHWPINPFHPLFEFIAVVSYIACGGMPNFRALLQGGLDQKSHMDITGTGLTEVQADSDVINKKNELVSIVKGDSRYGQESFPNKDSMDVHLAQRGSLVDDSRDETFWMIHEGTLSTEMQVDNNGTIKATWQVSDDFDYRPHWDSDKRSGFSYWFYNLTAEVVGRVYHDILGASDPMTTSATWTETIYPYEDNLQDQRGR